MRTGARRDMLPTLRRVAVLANPVDPAGKSLDLPLAQAGQRAIRTPDPQIPIVR
jgi:hypothetical protein